MLCQKGYAQNGQRKKKIQESAESDSSYLDKLHVSNDRQAQTQKDGFIMKRSKVRTVSRLQTGD